MNETMNIFPGNHYIEMNFETFCRYMIEVKTFCSVEYRTGYQYGLRRFFHGIAFGYDDHIHLLKSKGGKTASGLMDGLAGIAPTYKTDDFIV